MHVQVSGLSLDDGMHAQGGHETEAACTQALQQGPQQCFSHADMPQVTSYRHPSIAVGRYANVVYTHCSRAFAGIEPMVEVVRMSADCLLSVYVPMPFHA